METSGFWDWAIVFVQTIVASAREVKSLERFII